MKLSDRSAPLKQSGIRSMSARCTALGGINLGQGVCDIPTHSKIKEAAAKAINENKNLYAPHEGILELRNALAKKIKEFNHVEVNPQEEILIGHGSTGAFVAAAMTLFNPGDEVILIEPFYGYHKHVLELLGVNIAAVTMDIDTLTLDMSQLAKAVTTKTRGIVLCTPCNPSGKVFTKQELIEIGEFAKKHDLFIITDEIYEYITYPGYEHISIASLNDYKNRTVSLSGFSKTYNITGWRLGYAYGPSEIIKKMALVHDLLYICPPTPLQHAMLAALALDPSYFTDLRTEFLHKRDLTVNALRKMGFKLTMPQGAYYLMADFSAFGFADDQEAASKLLEHAKVAAVPGSSFYKHPEHGKHLLRFCFALSEEKITAALKNMAQYLESVKLVNA